MVAVCPLLMVWLCGCVVITGADVTVNVTPLLARPPTVTTTLPVVAPVGATATIEVELQLVIEVAVVPLNFTALEPCVDPKFVPVIVTDVPTGPDVGDSSVTVGVAPVIGKLNAFEVPPPGAGLTTVTDAVPGFATSVAVIAAVSCVLLINVVVRGEAFQSTCEPETNPAPFTVRVNAPDPAAILAGLVGLPAAMEGTGFCWGFMLPELPQAANPATSATTKRSWRRRNMANLSAEFRKGVACSTWDDAARESLPQHWGMPRPKPFS